MRLDTHPPSMSAAVALYRRFGFRDIPAAPLKPSAELAYMELELKSSSQSPSDNVNIS
jgi:hypothetical protein